MPHLVCHCLRQPDAPLHFIEQNRLDQVLDTGVFGKSGWNLEPVGRNSSETNVFKAEAEELTGIFNLDLQGQVLEILCSPDKDRIRARVCLDKRNLFLGTSVTLEHFFPGDHLAVSQPE